MLSFSLMRKLFFAVLISAFALWIAHEYVPGFSVQGGLRDYLIAGAVLGALNVVVKPILKVIAFPLMLLSLGLFGLIINALLLWALTSIVPSVMIAGFIPLAMGTLVMTAGNILVGWFS